MPQPKRKCNKNLSYMNTYKWNKKKTKRINVIFTGKHRLGRIFSKKKLQKKIQTECEKTSWFISSYNLDLLSMIHQMILKNVEKELKIKRKNHGLQQE